MATDRTRQLKSLVNSLPPINQQVAQQQQAARDIQLQQTISQAPSSGVSRIQPAATQVGTQQAAQAGAQAVQQAQQQTTQATQAGQLALQQQGAQLRQAAGQRELGAQRSTQELANQMSRLDVKLKNQLFDRQMEFQKNQAGRSLLNEQQLLDFASLKAQNDVEYAKYQQIAEQAWQKKLYSMQVANKKLEQVLNQGFLQEGQELSQAQIKQIELAKNALEDRIKREQTEAQNRMSMWQTGGTILGGAIGAYAGAGNPAAISAGASIGGALGAAASTK